MKKIILFCAALLGTVLMAGSAESAGPAEINLAGTRCNVIRGNGLLAEFEGRDAFRLNFDPAQTKAAEFTFDPLTIAETDKIFKIRLEAYLPEGKSPSAILLLLMDRDKEIFTFVQKPVGKTGWTVLDYRIDPAKTFSDTWGSKKANKKIDFPVRVFKIVCHYKQPGYIGFGKLSIPAPEKK